MNKEIENIIEEEIEDICPNCKERNPDIPDMPNGNCGACDGTGKIIFYAVGRIIR